MKKKIEITERQAQQMYDSGVDGLKSIAESNFPELFEKEKTWEDIGMIEGYYFGYDSAICSFPFNTPKQQEKNIYPTKEEAKRELALIQLRQWRDKANGEKLADWCDWNSGECKYVIRSFKEGWVVGYACASRFELAFKTEKIRDQFIKDHKSLIDDAFNI